MRNGQTNAIATRADDERTLTVLALKDDGIDCVQIGRRVGMSGSSVRKMIFRVRRDLAASEVR